MQRNMEFWSNKVAIVTGAGHGIGAQIAEDLARAGMTVIGLEPTEDNVVGMFDQMKAMTLTPGRIIPYKCDISKDEDLLAVFDGIISSYGGVDLLVNNAAIAKFTLLSCGEIEDFKRIIDVNIYGLLACTRLAIETMKKNNKTGLIINMNSICGHYMPPFAEPKANMYVASKRLMTVFNKLLNEELKLSKHDIKVTSVSPGIVNTGIFKSAGVTFLNDDFFAVNPHLSKSDVSYVIFMILQLFPKVHVKEMLFHAMNELY